MALPEARPRRRRACGEPCEVIRTCSHQRVTTVALVLGKAPTNRRVRHLTDPSAPGVRRSGPMLSRAIRRTRTARGRHAHSGAPHGSRPVPLAPCSASRGSVWQEPAAPLGPPRVDQAKPRRGRRLAHWTDLWRSCPRKPRSTTGHPMWVSRSASVRSGGSSWPSWSRKAAPGTASAGLPPVDAAGKRVTTDTGQELDYDALIVAVGAAAQPALEGALTFWGEPDLGRFRELLADLGREPSRLAFVVPGGATWPLPLYEIAFLTAGHLAERRSRRTELLLVTHEAAPLELFGPAASEAVGTLLEREGIKLHPGRYVTSYEDGTLRVVPSGEIPAERVVVLPRLVGPELRGLPQDENGFVPTDAYGWVRGLEHVYAAGDATFPVKQGGLAAQQADAVARLLAAWAGAAVDPTPFRPSSVVSCSPAAHRASCARTSPRAVATGRTSLSSRSGGRLARSPARTSPPSSRSTGSATRPGGAAGGDRRRRGPQRTAERRVRLIPCGDVGSSPQRLQLRLAPIRAVGSVPAPLSPSGRRP